MINREPTFTEVRNLKQSPEKVYVTGRPREAKSTDFITINTDFVEYCCKWCHLVNATWQLECSVRSKCRSQACQQMLHTCARKTCNFLCKISNLPIAPHKLTTEELAMVARDEIMIRYCSLFPSARLEQTHHHPTQSSGQWAHSSIPRSNGQ